MAKYVSPVRVRIRVDTAGFVRAMRGFTAAIHRLTVKDYRSHRRRCRDCNPRSYQPPMSVDGHAYHRRQRNRVKRKR